MLRRFALFAIAFSIVFITTGIFVNYASGLAQLGPAAVWRWPVAAVGQLLVVLVVTESAGHFPLAGANHQWTARLVGSRFGYVVGTLGVLYGAVGLPARHRADRPGWGPALLRLVAVVVALTLPEAFRSADNVVIGALALAGIWYVAALCRRLRAGIAGNGSARPDPVEIA